MGHITTRTIFCMQSYTHNLSFPSLFSTWLLLLCFYLITIYPLPMHERYLRWWSAGLGQLSQVINSSSTTWKGGDTSLRSLLSNGVGGHPSGSVLAAEAHTFNMLLDSLSQPFLLLLLANSVQEHKHLALFIKPPVCFYAWLLQESTTKWVRGEWHEVQTPTRQRAKIYISFGPPALVHLPLRFNCTWVMFSVISSDFYSPVFDCLHKSICFSFNKTHTKIHFKVVADFFLMGKH